MFQYRKRYEVTCDTRGRVDRNSTKGCFNTASGMRSHVTSHPLHVPAGLIGFNTASGMRSHVTRKFNDKRSLGKAFQYRKRYEVTCDYSTIYGDGRFLWGFNTASGMRSHVTAYEFLRKTVSHCFNTASGMRSHVTARILLVA